MARMETIEVVADVSSMPPGFLLSAGANLFVPARCDGAPARREGHAIIDQPRMLSGSGTRLRIALVPKGRLTKRALLPPSLRDSEDNGSAVPNAEALGYSQASLRDEILLACNSRRRLQLPDPLDAATGSCQASD